MVVEHHFVVGDKVTVNGVQGTVTRVNANTFGGKKFETVSVLFEDGTFDEFKYSKDLEGQGSLRHFELTEEQLGTENAIKLLAIDINSPVSCLVVIKFSNMVTKQFKYTALEPTKAVRFETFPKVIGAIVKTPRNSLMKVKKVRVSLTPTGESVVSYIGTGIEEKEGHWICAPANAITVIDDSDAEDAIVAIPEIRDDMTKVSSFSTGVISYVPVYNNNLTNFSVLSFLATKELSAF